MPSDQLALELGGSKRFEKIEIDRFDTFKDCLAWAKEKLRTFVTEFSQTVLSNWQLAEIKEKFPPLHREKIERHVALMSREFNSF